MNYKSTPEVSLGLPCYNEQDNIATVLELSATALNRLNRSWEILVVDNHSSDSTVEVVKKFIVHEPRVRLIVHETNRYYSGSCQTILNNAVGQHIAIMDSDGQFTADDLPLFLAKLESGANLVFGWRHHRCDPLSRKAMSKVFNWMAQYYLGFPLHDLNVGLRMFDRQFAESAKVRHTLNMANPELFVRARQAGLVCDEVPIQHAERAKGQTCHNFLRLFQLFKKVHQYFRDLSQELRSGLPVSVTAAMAEPKRAA